MVTGYGRSVYTKPATPVAGWMVVRCPQHGQDTGDYPWNVIHGELPLTSGSARYRREVGGSTKERTVNGMRDALHLTHEVDEALGL
ncbi:MAG: hypothetical protein NVSMB42_17910 [Herpetosiphon sp.]